ncbi:hypothetical protein F5880DRAFT_1542808 [Lentinula raphanica]|nr:hypothetical protein F5880DRAFT_1542808 [Lentinula raphanica]
MSLWANLESQTSSILPKHSDQISHSSAVLMFILHGNEELVSPMSSWADLESRTSLILRPAHSDQIPHSLHGNEELVSSLDNSGEVVYETIWRFMIILSPGHIEGAPSRSHPLVMRQMDSRSDLTFSSFLSLWFCFVVSYFGKFRNELTRYSALYLSYIM